MRTIIPADSPGAIYLSENVYVRLKYAGCLKPVGTSPDGLFLSYGYPGYGKKVCLTKAWLVETESIFTPEGYAE
jgi:SpoVK/Ycf46/Vps4 family AAA+-type ATPase